MVVAAFLLAATSACDRLQGYFSGYCAPANRTTILSVGPLYQTTASVYTGNAPQRFEITRATSSARGRAKSQILIGFACSC